MVFLVEQNKQHRSQSAFGKTPGEEADDVLGKEKNSLEQFGTLIW